ncbi:MAG: efflux transporter periplasmic adaptor subunit [Proteobacteria bacterium]|nr:MAG: efflux transporter periplasmic adaptor subunit [Pseudomonadota bacterium]
MKRLPWLLLIVLLPVAFFLGRLIEAPGHDPGPADDGATRRETRWTCSMHPQIILPDNDQQCPICSMDLIPLEEDSGGLGPRDLALSEEAAALIAVAVAPVERRFPTRRVPLVGRVTVDDDRVRDVTAWYAGRLDQLQVSTRGVSVRAGQPLARIYSPELYAAQVELQLAAQAVDTGEAEAATLRESARRKLALLGVPAERIAQIEAGTAPGEHVVINAEFPGIVLECKAVEGQYVPRGGVLYTVADLSRVRLTLEAYERDLTWLRRGQEVVFRTRNLPGQVFTGEIVFIDPILDERTRTCEVRVEVPNPDGLLKPGLLVSAQVEAVLAEGGVPVAGKEVARPPLVIPATAPLLTGNRAVVYVRRSVDEQTVYTGRTVELGPRADEFYLVASGLEEGEHVVVRGAFKIDSALQIQAKASMMSQASEPLPAAAPRHRPPMELPAAFDQDLGELLVATSCCKERWPLMTMPAAPPPRTRWWPRIRR